MIHRQDHFPLIQLMNVGMNLHSVNLRSYQIFNILINTFLITYTLQMGPLTAESVRTSNTVISSHACTLHCILQ